MPDNVIDAENIAVNKQKKTKQTCAHGIYILVFIHSFQNIYYRSSFHQTIHQYYGYKYQLLYGTFQTIDP